MALTQEQKQKIMNDREHSPKKHDSGMSCWSVEFADGSSTTFLTGICRSIPEVESAMLEKFGKKAIGMKVK